MAYETHECGRCGQQAGGYSKHELERQGWNWHPIAGIGSKAFVVCDDCEALAERRHAPAYALPPSEYCSECGTKHTILPAPTAVVGTPFRKALATAICPNCDRYPEVLRPRTEYEPDLLYPPAA